MDYIRSDRLFSSAWPRTSIALWRSLLLPGMRRSTRPITTTCTTCWLHQATYSASSFSSLQALTSCSGVSIYHRGAHYSTIQVLAFLLSLLTFVADAAILLLLLCFMLSGSRRLYLTPVALVLMCLNELLVDGYEQSSPSPRTPSVRLSWRWTRYRSVCGSHGLLQQRSFPCSTWYSFPTGNTSASMSTRFCWGF